MTEVWKPAPGLIGSYEISDLGNLRSLRNNKGLRKTPRPVKPFVTHDGYLKVSLTLDGKPVKKMIHHLVAEAFLGPRPAGMDCLHNDDNGQNARLDNLRWGTPKSNYEDRDANGGTAKGEKHGMAKISVELATKVKRAAQDRTRLARDIANEFGVTVDTVRNIRNNKNWKWLEV